MLLKWWCLYIEILSKENKTIHKKMVINLNYKNLEKKHNVFVRQLQSLQVNIYNN